MIVDTLDDVEVFRAWLRRQDTIAIDTETNITDAEHERFLVGISIYGKDAEPWYLPVGHEHPFVPVENVELWDFSKDLRPTCILIFHNAKFDLKVLRKAGVDLTSWYFADTMLWHHLIDSNDYAHGGIGHALQTLEIHFLKKDVKKDLAKRIKNVRKEYGMEGVPPIAMAPYATNDVASTYELYELFLPMMKQLELMPIWEVDREFLLLLMQLEESGLRLDQPESLRLADEATIRMGQIAEALPFEPSKDLQAAERFFSDPPVGLGYKPFKRTPSTNRPSVDAKALGRINHPEAGLLLEYRGLQKATSTWFLGYPNLCDQGGYLHPTFKQHGTVTHRLSAENPNPQQLPREGPVRKLFLPEDGCDLWEFDYKAVEFRLAAVYANIPELLEAFVNGLDIHQVVADRLGIARFLAKNVNFTIIYGGREQVLFERYGVPLQEGRAVIREYERQYPELFAIAKTCQKLAEQRGYVKYWDGRRRIFIHKYHCKDAFNSIVQGGAFQIIKKSMLMLAEQGVDIRNQVHDSIWINHPKGESTDKITSTMVDWTIEKFGIPFDVEAKVLHA